ncbi:MAG: transposase [Fusobacterium sp.]|nr:transposase [Fusobacterium sp.]
MSCKYHIVFILKYRWQIIYGKIRRDIEKLLGRL